MENLHGKFKQDERSLEFPNYQSSTNKYLSNESYPTLVSRNFQNNRFHPLSMPPFQESKNASFLENKK